MLTAEELAKTRVLDPGIVGRITSTSPATTGPEVGAAVKALARSEGPG